MTANNVGLAGPLIRSMALTDQKKLHEVPRPWRILVIPPKRVEPPVLGHAPTLAESVMGLVEQHTFSDLGLQIQKSTDPS